MGGLGLFSRTDHKPRGESSQCLLRHAVGTHISCCFAVIVVRAFLHFVGPGPLLHTVVRRVGKEKG